VISRCSSHQANGTASKTEALSKFTNDTRPLLEPNLLIQLNGVSYSAQTPDGQGGKLLIETPSESVRSSIQRAEPKPIRVSVVSEHADCYSCDGTEVSGTSGVWSSPIRSLRSD
jgi:hypothetical protein